jgi:integrase
MQNIRSTFSVLFYLNTGKTKKSGKCPIVGRISVDGKNTAFSTGLEILPSDWDAGSGMATGKSKENIDVNQQIERYRSEIAGHYQTMLDSRGYVTAESLKNALQGIGTDKNTVMREFTDLMNEKSKSVGILITKSTMVKYRVAIKHFRNFLMEKYAVDDISFGKLDIELIESFVQYMKVDLRMSPNTVRISIKPLRTAAKRAFHRGVLRQDPFLDYKPEKIISKRRWISYGELDRIMQVKMEYPTIDFTKDMFVFACFTGISYADLFQLKHNDIQEQDGSRIIVFKRRKTGVASCIPILPAAQAILDRHADSQFTGWGGMVFRMQTLTMMERHLKEIAKAAKVDKCLTFHMARHTFATTVCMSNGVPIETVSRMLGHSSINTTQIYAEITRTKINEDMTVLEKRIEGKYKPAEDKK